MFVCVRPINRYEHDTAGCRNRLDETDRIQCRRIENTRINNGLIDKNSYCYYIFNFFFSPKPINLLTAVEMCVVSRTTFVAPLLQPKLARPIPVELIILRADVFAHGKFLYTHFARAHDLLSLTTGYSLSGRRNSVNYIIRHRVFAGCKTILLNKR